MWKAALILLEVVSIASVVTCARSDDRKHNRNMSCYSCHTLTHADLCLTVNESQINNFPKANCLSGERYCQVRRFSFSANGTEVKVWMMERKCSSACTNECVITGDRSKLHLCTSCCEQNLCNFGNDAVSASCSFSLHIITCFALLISLVIYQR